MTQKLPIQVKLYLLVRGELAKVFHFVRRKIAKTYLDKYQKNVHQIGITGSYGKTTITHYLHTILNDADNSIKTSFNLDTIYNVPITVLKLRNHKYAVFELGVDSIGEMDKHLEIVKPEVSIINGIAPVHADEKHMKSVENIIIEKRKLIECLNENETAILNYDDEQVRKMASSTKAKVIFYGSDEKCEYQVKNLNVQESSIIFDLNTPYNNYSAITLNVIGGHNAINLASAVACAEKLGLTKKQILSGIAKINPLKSRLNIEEGPIGTKFINDSIRSNTASTKAAVDYFKNLNTSKGNGKKVMLLGQMGEIGQASESEHRKLGKMITPDVTDILVCFAGETKFIFEESTVKDKYYVETPVDAAEILKEKLNKNDYLLVKGSLLTHMERVIMLLNNEEVNCNVSSCPLYNNCRNCKYRYKGYPY